MNGLKRYQLQTGTVLDGRYVIDGVLGEGGFGITYEGRNTRIDMHVAIKEFFCREYMDRDVKESDDVWLMDEALRTRFEKEKGRFLKEARILSDFSSESGIVHVMDYFEINGTAYIVMQFLEGCTLKEYVRKNGRMDAETIFRRMKPLMAALGKVHESGLIHRDISPDNIMMLRDGSLCLIDFGAAEHYDEKTKSYSSVFKNGYSAFELYQSGNQAGPAADVYSLAAVIYFCITAADPTDAFQRSLVDELKLPNAMGVSLSEPAEKILADGLALSLKKRIPDMQELLQRTEEAFPETMPEQKGRRKYIIAGVIALLVILAVAFGYIYYSQHKTEIRFRNIETEKVWLRADESMSVQDYQEAADIVKSRTEVFAGKDNYIWREEDGGIFVEFPRDCLLGKNPVYVFQCYLSRPLNIYLLRDDLKETEQQDLQSYLKEITREQIEKVELLTGQIPSLDRSAYGMPEEGDYRYLQVFLKEDAAEILQRDAGIDLTEQNRALSLYYDVDRDFSEYYYEKAISTGDGRSFYLINTDQEGTFIDTLKYDLSHPVTKEAFYITEEPIIQWEQTASNTAAGEYQKNENEITGDVVYYAYASDGIADLKKQKGAWLHTTTNFKERLDSLKIHYAFGTSPFRESEIIIKTEKNALTYTEATLLGTEVRLKTGADIRGYNSAWLENSIGLQEEDGQYALRVKIGFWNESEKNNRRKQHTEWFKAGRKNIYLFAGDIPIAVKPLTEETDFEEDGTVHFYDSFLLGKDSIKESDQGLVTFLNTAMFDNPPFSYKLQAFWELNEQEKPLYHKVSDLPEYPAFPADENLQSFTELAESLGGEVTVDNSNPVSVNYLVSMRGCPEKQFLEYVLEQSGKLYPAFRWDNDCCGALQLHFYREGDETSGYYLIFYKNAQTTAPQLYKAGTGAENAAEMNQQMKTLLEKDPLFGNLEKDSLFSYVDYNWY